MSNTSKKEIIVLGIIVKSDEVLVGKVRKNKLDDFGGLKYVFPGGTVENHERVEEAVEREIREETMLDVKVKSEISMRIHPVTGKETHYVHCEFISGEPASESPMNDDIESYNWVKKEKLLNFMPTLDPQVKAFLS